MEDEKIPVKTKTHKNYYQILKVHPDAVNSDIEEAYLSLSTLYGPDAMLDAAEADLAARLFKDIKDAYEVLSDPAKRREYDKNMAANRHQAGDVRALWTKVTSVASGNEADTTVGPIQALSLELTAEVTMKEAVKGTKRIFDISDPTPCEECSALKPVARMQCGTCRGLGYFNVDRKEEVDLPPGMYEGMEVRRQELGRYDLRAGKYGDLVVKIKIAEHPYLRIAGNDITCLAPVTLYEAILGAEIEVPTATGKVMVKIQPLSQPGMVYRLKGLGLNGGDQLITIEVRIPTSLSADELSLFRRLKSLHKETNPRDKYFAK